jgi:2-iminobutanoate/2-iminopropanoate deaminase
VPKPVRTNLHAKPCSQAVVGWPGKTHRHILNLLRTRAALTRRPHTGWRGLRVGEETIDLGSMNNQDKTANNPGKTASDQEKTAISTKAAPAAIGPYSQAVRVGDTLFASGQVGLDPATGQLVSGGITEQTVRVLENVKAVLGEAGLGLVNVVKTTVFLKNMSDFAAMNEVYAKYLAPEGVVPPARSTVAVAGLPKDALVEIEVIAKETSGA